MKQLRITVAGQTFDVTVETIGASNEPAAAVSAPRVAAPAAPASAPVQPPSPAPAPAAPVSPAPTAGGAPVPSPLAGKVVSLDVAAGAQVKEGDQLLTLEAMKMNTVIYSPAAGAVSFAVQPGQAVQEGQVLATLA